MVIVVTRRTALVGMAFLTLLALVAVSLVAPSIGRATTTFTRSASCAGLSFYPADSQARYSNEGALQVAYDGNGAGSEHFRCGIALPDHAVVTQVQFTLNDAGTSQMGGHEAAVPSCELARADLAVSANGGYQTMASVGTTTIGGGVERRSTRAISFATVNDSAYSYWLECFIAWPFSGEGIYGGEVTYTIAAPYA